MHKSSRRIAAVLTVGVAAAVLAGCSSVGGNKGSTVTVEQRAATTPVDPGPYQRSGSLYVFSVGGGQTVCGIGLDQNSGQMGNLTCHVPPGTGIGDAGAIDVDGDGVHAAGWNRWTGAPDLPVGKSLTVGTATCEVYAPGSVKCANHGGWVDVTPTKTTTSAGGGETTQVPSTATQNGAPMEHYTDGTTPVAPGTMCGAATGRTLVQVVSGSISCTDAIDLIDGYLAAPADPMGGNAKMMVYRGWRCSAPTAVAAREMGFGAKCEKDGTVVITPAG
ncbi:MAG: hypothetical protein QM774_12160 [Gordonia sp. (in: high G+C Gram-positive bacteria)]|uniref:hypothetical protein n=1 Tax=Gordonia sp. (in: high G+C Gram-positive bacteria) TaxID=84139 RepID=UPI0039E64532